MACQLRATRTYSTATSPTAAATRRRSSSSSSPSSSRAPTLCATPAFTPPRHASPPPLTRLADRGDRHINRGNHEQRDLNERCDPRSATRAAASTAAAFAAAFTSTALAAGRRRFRPTRRRRRRRRRTILSHQPPTPELGFSPARAAHRTPPRPLPRRPFANGGGFAWEVRAKYPHDELLIDLFQNLFTNLPIASLVGEWALVIHGGLFREEDVTLDDIRAIDACRQPPSVLQARHRTPAQ